MKTTFTLFFSVVVFSVAHAQTRIGIQNVVASSRWADADRAPQHMINSNGLHLVSGTGNDYSDVWRHDSDAANGKMWMSANSAFPHSVRFDLGGSHLLHTMRIWNCNWKPGSDWTIRGAKDYVLYVSDLANPGAAFNNSAEWTAVRSGTLLRAPGTPDYEGENIMLEGINAKWVGIRFNSNYGGELFATISEVQFYGSRTPEFDNPEFGNIVIHEITDNSATLSADVAMPGNNGDSYNALLLARPLGINVWTTTNNLGVIQSPSLTSTLQTLLPDSEYEYAFASVAQSDGRIKIGATNAFDTGAVSLAFSPTNQHENNPDMITLSITRPASVTRQQSLMLDVKSGRYADYTPAFPASVMFEQGQNEIRLPLTLLDNSVRDGNRDITVSVSTNMLSSIIDERASATFTIVDDDDSLSGSEFIHCMPITVTGYRGTSVLTNFVMAVRLSERIPNFRYSDFRQPNGKDLRFTDDTGENLLSHEIDTWNTNGTSLAWVQIPLLDPSAPPKIFAFWGQDTLPASDNANNHAVWRDGFNAVYHLSDTDDATHYGNNGHYYADRIPPVVDGLLGKAHLFNSTNRTLNATTLLQNITVPNSQSIGSRLTTTLSYSAWINSEYALDSNKNSGRVLEKDNQYFFVVDNNVTSVGALVKNGSNQNNIIASSSESFGAGEWVHIAAVVRNGILSFYANGEFCRSTSIPAMYLFHNDNPLCIGSDYSDTYPRFNGMIDEVRIESAARSADWIKASYDNQKSGSSFLAYDEVGYVPMPTMFIFL